MRRLWLTCIVGLAVIGVASYVGGARLFDAARDSAPKAKYHCPMHPQYVSDRPGDCPICGMRLVPIQAHTGEASAVPGHQGHGHAEPPAGGTDAGEVPGYAAVTIPSEQQAVMGMVLDRAKITELERIVLAVGRVAYDETRLHHIHTRFEGYIESLYVNFVGQPVKAGQGLFSVYSPELLVTQNEYLLALEGGQKSLAESAKRRLQLWNIPNEEIARLEKTRRPSKAVVIRSPIDGYVTAKTAVHGMRVMPQDNVYDVADLSVVWVVADIYEMDLPFVKVGQPAEISLAAEPGRVRRAAISYIYPAVEGATRTVKVRFELDNAAGDLKPDMFANVRIASSLGQGLTVPESAVLSTGERKIVFVAKEGGMFQPRYVETGVKVRGSYEIVKGLTAGETVVTGANFLLDSESRLKASVSDAGGH